MDRLTASGIVLIPAAIQVRVSAVGVVGDSIYGQTHISCEIKMTYLAGERPEMLEGIDPHNHRHRGQVVERHAVDIDSLFSVRAASGFPG